MTAPNTAPRMIESRALVGGVLFHSLAESARRLDELVLHLLLDHCHLRPPWAYQLNSGANTLTTIVTNADCSALGVGSDMNHSATFQQRIP
jgi:hypothetical protein